MVDAIPALGDNLFPPRSVPFVTCHDHMGHHDAFAFHKFCFNFFHASRNGGDGGVASVCIISTKDFEVTTTDMDGNPL
jgi:hypothetical protein